MASPVRFAKIRKQLEAAGYRLVRISSSHHIFDRPGGPLVSIPVHNNLMKPFYAKQVAKIIAADKAKGRSGEPDSEKGDHGQARKAGIDLPFAADVLKRAKEVVADYQFIVNHEDGEWYGRGLELPQVFGDGKSPAECIENTREALAAAVAYLIERGQPFPTPAKHGKRTRQVNVRLTPEEKTILEGMARQKGFQGLGDFIRASALEAVG